MLFEVAYLHILLMFVDNYTQQQELQQELSLLMFWQMQTIFETSHSAFCPTM